MRPWSKILNETLPDEISHLWGSQELHIGLRGVCVGRLHDHVDDVVRYAPSTRLYIDQAFNILAFV